MKVLVKADQVLVGLILRTPVGIGYSLYFLCSEWEMDITGEFCGGIAVECYSLIFGSFQIFYSMFGGYYMLIIGRILMFGKHIGYC